MVRNPMEGGEIANCPLCRLCPLSIYQSMSTILEICTFITLSSPVM